VLFPEATTNGGSPRVTANQKLQTAWMRFDDTRAPKTLLVLVRIASAGVGGRDRRCQRSRPSVRFKDAAKTRTVRDFSTAFIYEA